MNGIIVGLVGCIAGLGIVIRTEIQCKKDRKEIEDIMKQVEQYDKELNDMLEQLKMK